jgi:hypothetical protein
VTDLYPPNIRSKTCPADAGIYPMSPLRKPTVRDFQPKFDFARLLPIP